jgi:hypothetical protein
MRTGFFAKNTALKWLAVKENAMRILTRSVLFALFGSSLAAQVVYDSIAERYQNDATTGTVQYGLVNVATSGANRVVQTPAGSSTPIGICRTGCGVDGTAQITVAGVEICRFDNRTTAGDSVQVSPTLTNNCHDTGSQTQPSSGFVGYVLSTNAAAGYYRIQLQIGGAGASSGSSSAGLAVQVGGAAIATQPTLDFESGTGITQACSNDVPNSRVRCTPAYNAALIPTHDTVHADENICASSNGTTAMTCNMPNKALTAYPLNGCFDFVTDVANPVSIAIDGLSPPVTLDLADGSTALPTGLVLPHFPFTACYDGTVFRLKSIQTGFVLTTTGPSGPASYANGVLNIPNPVINSPAPGTGATLTAPSEFYHCSGGTPCAMVLPIPVAGYQFCVDDDAGVTASISFANPGTGVMYEKSDHSGYGTATSGTAVSTSGAYASICFEGKDATHYNIYGTPVGTWTMN